MTMREYLNAVANAHINDELDAKTADLLAALDKKNAQRSSKPSKTAIANEPIKAAIIDHLQGVDEPMTAEAVGAACGITTSKASALLVQLAKAERVTSCEVKVKGKGKVKGYRLA